jgi:hypothetical protein
MGETRVRPKASEVREIIALMVSLSPSAAEALTEAASLPAHYAHIQARDMARALILGNTLSREDADTLTAYLVKYPQVLRRDEVDAIFGREITLRMPLTMEAKVDEAAGRLGLYVNAYIREAVAEKLERDAA